MPKTKIVCTLGPATDKQEVLEQLVEKGMNVARFNFSHGTHEIQKRCNWTTTCFLDFSKLVQSFLLIPLTTWPFIYAKNPTA